MTVLDSQMAEGLAAGGSEPAGQPARSSATTEPLLVRLIIIAIAVGVLSSLVGAYLSYFLDGATGGIIVVLQTLVFLLAFVFAPKHGMLANRRKGRLALEHGRAPL